MCGIFGRIESSKPNVKALDGRHMSFIGCRGPDGSGMWEQDYSATKIELFHTRLSIIDTSDHASQPMQDEYCDWVITFNGEIFNYLELREELRALGWTFHTESDTEVLLKAWTQWGLEALQRLNGMFAFGVVNRKTGQMWLVRDRFGVKPLLWARTESGGLIFSSSLAAVAQSLGAPVNVDYCAFGLRYKVFEGPEGETAFQGIQSLPPGGWLNADITATGVAVHEGRWYDLQQAVSRKLESIARIGDTELLEQCRDLLHDAVRIRLRSDVPLAVSLSGGVDSSTVAATAAGLVENLHGFTYGSAHARSSEGPVVARFAQQVGITPHFIWPRLDAVGLNALLERTLTCQEAPFPGLSVMAQNEVFRTVREAGFKVLLGGQGGDEIFGGYRKFFIVATRHALHKRDITEAARLLYSLGLMLMHEAGAAGVYLRALNRYSADHSSRFSLFDWTPRPASLWGEKGGSLAQRQIEDIQRWSIPTLLRYEDRNSMGHGVESRLPFMDYRLVELALALPCRLKIANGFGKWALRRITEGVVPDFVRLNRRKRGFDVAQSWIEDGLGASLRERIGENREKLAPYLREGLSVNQHLSDSALQSNTGLLDEALMLAWLIQPIRERNEAETKA